MHQPLDIAAVIVEKQQAAGRTTDKLQLQKLLYLVQSTHYELWNEPAMKGEFLAYARGPVVRPVEKTYRDAYPDSYIIESPIGGRPQRVADEVLATIQYVVDTFGDWEGTNLEAFVKRSGMPWTETRGDLAADANSSRVIPETLIVSWARRHGTGQSEPLTDAEREAFARLATGDHGALAELI